MGAPRRCRELQQRGSQREDRLREFSTWKERLNGYNMLTGVDKLSQKEQRASLYTIVDDEWYRIIKFGLSDVTDPSDLDETISAMEKHLRSQRNVILDRRDFYRRNQATDEPFDDYLIALKEISEFCDFCKHCTEDRLRDRLITGLCDEAAVQTLLSETNLTLQKTVDICRARENAYANASALTGDRLQAVSAYRRGQRNRLFGAAGEELDWKGTFLCTLKLGKATASSVTVCIIPTITGALLSWDRCIELGILPTDFPKQISCDGALPHLKDNNNISSTSKSTSKSTGNLINKLASSCQDASPSTRHQVQQPATASPTLAPPTYPVWHQEQGEPSEEVKNQHLNMLKTAFSEVFDVNRPLREMIGGPMKIVLNEDAQPYAVTAPRSIPFAWRDKAKEQLDKLQRDGIISEEMSDDESHPAPDLLIDEIRAAARHDDEYQALTNVILQGFPDQKADLPSSLRQYWHVKDSLTLDDNETLLSTPHFFQLPGFSIIRHDYGRGILIAVRDRPGLTWKTLDCTDFEPGDYLIQGVSVGDDRLRDAVSVYNVYASHCSAVDDWRFLEQIENLPGPSLVLGDFNARSPAWCASGQHNSNGKALEELLSDSGLQLLTSPTPTRLADRPGDSDTTIDLAFSAGDVPGDVFWAPTYHGASDHLLCEESYRDSGQFWRFIGSIGDSKPQTSSMQMVAGSRILRTDEEKGSAFLQRFVDQCSRGDMARRDEAIRDLSSRLPQLAPSELFGMDDLTRAIERIGQVSPGPDRIPASALKNLSAQSKSRLLSEINESLVSGIVPTEWCDSVLVPVPKPGKDHHRLEGHRIIAVQNLLGKMAESMVCERLASHLEPRMPPGMGAYRKGRSTWTNAGVVTHVISEAFERREQAVLVALDLQDAYNMVSLPKLAHRLLVLDTDVRLTRWIMAALRSRRCSMKCGRWMSDWTDVPTALPQGSPLSPICFNAYLQPIASIITPDNAILLCYADDITIVAWHRDISSAIGTAQEVVNNVKAACDHLDMVINPQKASVTVFGKRRPTQPLEAVVYGGEPISYSDQVKLLGVTLDPALTFNAHADSVRSRCVRALSTLKAAYSRGVDLRRSSHLYRSLVLSRITYGLEIINPLKTTMDKLERIQNSALRLATGCPRQTPVTALRYMFDLPSIVDLHEVLRARAVCIVASDCGHPLHGFVDQALARAPLARLQRTGWLRDGTKALRGLCGRHKIRRSHLWSATPPATRCR
ncbi:putative RNA-directed DNA polymerase from transposon BS [Amphibalanus amphitrite]|uniref:Putative RNA-directed DNA polymerase from transposon BS n=1 Tax=Amphibalanus amphitrite TaxID=1232801 RepID=A0A6A4WML8_AMPAM|nr:putative RNA-directed DNA polymerase from transposon BS [Amphibalanus amphitrite]